MLLDDYVAHVNAGAFGPDHNFVDLIGPNTVGKCFHLTNFQHCPVFVDVQDYRVPPPCSDFGRLRITR